jgi:AraC-like DNA-binding protein
LVPRLPAPDENVALISRLAARVVDDRTITCASRLSSLSGVSARALQRLFRRYVGVGPKWMIRVYRLHDAAERLAKEHAPDFAQTALDLGYADQAHFIKDFKAIIGQPPAQYAATCAKS